MKIEDRRLITYESYCANKCYSDPHLIMFQRMPKRWRIYVIDWVTKFGMDYRTAIKYTFVYGISKRLWVCIDGHCHWYKSFPVKVSHRGHIYLE